MILDDDAKFAYECIQNEFADNEKVQEELRQIMTEENKQLNKRLSDIEAQALGLQKDAMDNLTDINSGAVVSKEKTEQFQENVEKAMLSVPHETFTDNKMQYKGGKIIPIDWKDVKKNELVSTGRK